MENQTELNLEDFSKMLNLDFSEESTKKQIEEEKPKEDVDDQVEVEEPLPPTPPQQENTYLKDLKDKLEKGEIDDVVLEIDGEKVTLSELEDIDEETYNTILEEDTKAKEAEFKESYIEIKGMSDIQKALINIVKSGDLEKAKELFAQPERLQEPFQNYDPTNDAHNEYVLTMYYKSEGKTDKEIKALINIAKEDLNLDTKAETIVNHQRKLYRDSILNQEKLVQQEKLQEQENIKKYSKDLSTSFKERGITSESIIKKFVASATKQTPQGELEIDNVYEEWMKDPKKASELIHFMLDKEDYLNNSTKETKRNVHKNILREVKILRDTKTTTKPENKKEAEVPELFKGMKFD